MCYLTFLTVTELLFRWGRDLEVVGLLVQLEDEKTQHFFSVWIVRRQKQLFKATFRGIRSASYWIDVLIFGSFVLSSLEGAGELGQALGRGGHHGWGAAGGCGGAVASTNATAATTIQKASLEKRPKLSYDKLGAILARWKMASKNDTMWRFYWASLLCFVVWGQAASLWRPCWRLILKQTYATAFSRICALLQSVAKMFNKIHRISELQCTQRATGKLGKRKPLIKKNTMRRRKLLFISTQNKNVKNDKYACKMK